MLLIFCISRNSWVVRLLLLSSDDCHVLNACRSKGWWWLMIYQKCAIDTDTCKVVKYIYVDGEALSLAHPRCLAESHTHTPRCIRFKGKHTWLALWFYSVRSIYTNVVQHFEMHFTSLWVFVRCLLVELEYLHYSNTLCVKSHLYLLWSGLNHTTPHTESSLSIYTNTLQVATNERGRFARRKIT